ncbi:hypothetical protein CHU93_12585 [Sandarakinorhabdus cyanobacteriorum]|uniref:Putative auto-transporter adhesin head GIN domain-containing protein n=1 Tax=Sandarakinorhabdus cyanobacteriorum TaxID=1981098 RepID=A0A255Y9Z6_9SPHN|nr:DUF2807 domain-containing protein [Sandarakinorhabdus cyanobacteriorum]OYQ26029.1 hypothetical protein CHU93_12585 [Sandarakinorhabdus cyanobacteriorum]
MTRTALLVAAMLIATPALAAERSFPNTGFTHVIIEGSDDALIRKGGFSVVASGETADLDQLQVRQEGTTLRIGRKQQGWRLRSKDVQLMISLPALAAVTVSGSGDVAVADQAGAGGDVALRVSGSGNLAVPAVQARALSASISGSGNMAVGGITAETVTTALSGSGDMAVAGRCTNLDARLSGSGDLDAAKLGCTGATVATSGSGDVSIRATGTVSARSSGSGDIMVTGGARCTSRSSGSGTIRCN